MLRNILRVCRCVYVCFYVCVQVGEFAQEPRSGQTHTPTHSHTQLLTHSQANFIYFSALASSFLQFYCDFTFLHISYSIFTEFIYIQMHCLILFSFAGRLCATNMQINANKVWIKSVHIVIFADCLTICRQTHIHTHTQSLVDMPLQQMHVCLCW